MYGKIRGDRMKTFKNNPRKMKEEKLNALKKDLKSLGDLSGIVHDMRTDELVGGNHRMCAMFGDGADGFKIQDADIEIVKEYPKPTKSGTVAEGYVVWNGERYNYRKVKWDEKKFKRANIVANMQKADWDWNKMAENFDSALLVEWGFDSEFVAIQENNLEGGQQLLSSIEGFDSGFNPNLTPSFSTAKVIEVDIVKEKAKLDNCFKGNEEYLEVTCPHCGESFFIEKEKKK